MKALVGFASRFEEMQDLLAQIVLLNGETSDRQVDPDAEAIKLTTVHQAKGLEYDVVFLIGLADGQFPGRRSIEAGDVEEERRLFYVAVTRARNELYLVAPLKFMLTQQPRNGDAHVYGARSRFVTEKLLKCCEQETFHGSHMKEGALGDASRTDSIDIGSKLKDMW